MVSHAKRLDNLAMKIRHKQKLSTLDVMFLKVVPSYLLVTILMSYFQSNPTFPHFHMKWLQGKKGSF